MLELKTCSADEHPQTWTYTGEEVEDMRLIEMQVSKVDFHIFAQV